MAELPPPRPLEDVYKRQDVKVNVGDHVEANQLVLMLEAMKMENEIFTPVAGTVVGVHVKKGDSVNSDDLLISIG